MKKWIIGICDDSYEWYLKAKRIIDTYINKTGEEAEILYFQDKDSLLENKERMDVLFMDIVLCQKDEDENGIQLAGFFREKQEDCQIVYLTNYLFYAVDVYETEHSYFVIKEQFEDRIEKVFEKIKHNLKQSINVLPFSVINEGKIVLKPEEILFFERKLRETEIVTETGKYKIWNKLDEIEAFLPKPDFVRCHNSYIVNLPNIREMQKKIFLMKDGSKIVISRGHQKEVKNAFMKWASMQSS